MRGERREGDRSAEQSRAWQGRAGEEEEHEHGDLGEKG